MPHAVELLYVPSTELYRNDPTSLKPVLEIVESSKGSLGIYQGSVLEEPETLFILIIWETLEAHLALINDKEAYPKLGAALSQCADLSKMELFHAYFEGDLTPIVNAPFTSFTRILGANPGKTAADVETQLKAMTALPNVKGSYGGVWGKVVEKEEHVILYGWDDPKEHQVFAQREDTAKVITDLLAASEKNKRGHVKFTMYKKYQA